MISRSTYRKFEMRLVSRRLKRKDMPENGFLVKNELHPVIIDRRLAQSRNFSTEIHRCRTDTVGDAYLFAHFSRHDFPEYSYLCGGGGTSAKPGASLTFFRKK